MISVISSFSDSTTGENTTTGYVKRLFVTFCDMSQKAIDIRPRKVDFVVAVGIWVGFGPELGSEKNSPKINKKLIFMHSISQIYP